MLKKSHYKIGIFLAACIILLGIIFTSLRGLSTYLNHYQPVLEDLASQATGYSIKISRIKLGWYGFRPVVKVVDVVIRDEANNQVVMQSDMVKIGINLLKSVYNWQIYPNFLYLSDSVINIHTSPTSKMSLNKIDAFETQALQQFWRDYTDSQWIEALRTVIVNKATFNWFDQSGNITTVKNIQLRVKRIGSTINLMGSAQLDQVIPTKFQLHGIFKDSFEQIFLFAKIDDLDVNRWLANFQVNGISVQNGILNTRTWLKIQAGQPVTLTSELELSQSRLIDSIGNQDRFIEHLAGQFYWQKSQQESRLRGQQINLISEDISWKNNYFEYNYLKSKALKKHHFDIGKINVELITPFLARVISLHAMVEDELATIKPHGELAKLSIDYFEYPNRQDWQVKTDVQGLGWQTGETIPGIEGLSGRLNVNPNHGELRLKSTQISPSIDARFDKTLALSYLRGNISWDKQKEGWAIQGHSFLLDNPIIHTTGRFSLLFPYQNTGTRVDVESKFNIFNLAYAKVYLPDKLLSTALYQWLDNAIAADGQASGTFKLKGNMKNFPFEQNEGVFTIDSDIYGLDFNYLTGWPPLEDMNAKLIFQNQDMYANIHSATVIGIPLKDINITLLDITREQARIEISGNIITDSRNAIQYIQQSPLIDSLGFLNEIQATGPLDLSLDIKIPFDDPANMEFLGTVNITDNQFNLAQWSTQLESVNGQLQFTQEGILDGHYQALFLGESTDIALKTRVTSSGNKFTEINFSGHLDVADLSKQYDLQLTNIAQGRSFYEGELKIAHQAGTAHELTIDSDLVGMSIYLPEPMKKDAKLSMPFHLSARIEDRGFDLGVNFADHLNANLQYVQDQNLSQLDSQARLLGDHKESLVQKKAYIINATISTFSLEDWYAYYQQWAKKQETKQVDWFKHINLNDLSVHIQQANLFGQSFADLDINVQPVEQDWSIVLHNQDMDGTIKLSDPFQARFKYLHLNDEVDTTAFKGQATLNPGTLPSLDILIADLSYQSKPLGTLRVLTHSKETQMDIEVFSLKSDLFNFESAGLWHMQKEAHQTSLHGTLQTHNLTKFLKLLGMRDRIGSSDAKVNFDLTWDNPLTKLSLYKLNGEIAFILKNGYIRDLSRVTESVATVGRLFDLLNVEKLPNRLRLQFSDMDMLHFGFTFDTFQGHFIIKDSIAMTEDTYLEGPVAYISMQGDINFVEQSYHSKFIIIPNVKSSFTGIAAILGGPAAAVITWLINKTIEALNTLTEKLFNKSIIADISYTHVVSGTWGEAETT